MAGIYIHVPFCKRRCIYCDFFSTTQSEQKPNYVRALCQELHLRKDYLEGEDIETVYLGGGTPSQLTQEELRTIFRNIYNIYKGRGKKAEILPHLLAKWLYCTESSLAKRLFQK